MLVYICCIIRSVIHLTKAVSLGLTTLEKVSMVGQPTKYYNLKEY